MSMVQVKLTALLLLTRVLTVNKDELKSNYRVEVEGTSVR